MTADEFGYYFQQYVNSRSYTSSGGWHAARVFVWLIGTRQNIKMSIWQVTGNFQQKLVSLSIVKFLDACQLAGLILQQHFDGS